MKTLATMNMKQQTIIREETAADLGTIDQVTVAAFQSLSVSNHTERFIIAALRAAKAVMLSLVALLRMKSLMVIDGQRLSEIWGKQTVIT